jgi:hypothetical protein
MSKFFFFAAMIFVLGIARGQENSRDFRAGISYLSEGGLYPGVAINCETALLANDKFQVLLGAKAGAYFHYRNHTGVFAMVQSGQRFRIHRKLYFEHFIGLGYLHSFLSGGDAYYVNASGSIKKASNSGNPHFMPSVSLGLSYGFTVAERPVMIFGRPLIFWQIPFNKGSLVQYALEIGVLFQLKK